MMKKCVLCEHTQPLKEFVVCMDCADAADWSEVSGEGDS